MAAGELNVNVPGGADHVSALNIDVGTFGTDPNKDSSYYIIGRDIGAGNYVDFAVTGRGYIISPTIVAIIDALQQIAGALSAGVAIPRETVEKVTALAQLHKPVEVAPSGPPK